MAKSLVVQNIIVQLKTNITYMTKVEKKIAKLIIDNPGEFITYSMKELAEKADISQGSIINFANKFVNGGFPELKLQISACLGIEKEKKFDFVSAGDTIKDVLEKTVHAYNAAYDLTGDINSEHTLSAVADKILKAKKVEIYGVFRSATVATDFCYQLLQLGIPATFVSDILTCSITASMLDESTLVIAISSSGKTKDIVDAVKNAKSNNVPIVAITSNGASPLAKLADDVLIASASGTSVSGNASEIRASQLLITDTICSYIRNKNVNNEKRYYELKEILSSHNIEEGEIHE